MADDKELDLLKLIDAALRSDNPDVKKRLGELLVLVALLENTDENKPGPLSELMRRVELLEAHIMILQQELATRQRAQQWPPSGGQWYIDNTFNPIPGGGYGVGSGTTTSSTTSTTGYNPSVGSLVYDAVTDDWKYEEWKKMN